MNKQHNTTEYDCTIVADSINQQGDRITSMLVTYPRIVHAEMCRHRMHSRNTASSRAIPFKTMVKNVKEHPFIPIAWQKPHSGMQGNEYYDHTLKKEPGGSDYTNLPQRWLRARDTAVSMAEIMADETLNMPVTKQLCNRLLESFVWVTEIITATEWENFFNLRCPQYLQQGKFYRSKKDAIRNHPTEKQGLPVSDLDWLQVNKSQADIHIQAIAELMWDAINESTPDQLEAGEWHIPFGDNIEESKLSLLHYGNIKSTTNIEALYNDSKIKIATARCARTSYINYEGKDDYSADIKLHDRLVDMHHMSPMEHCTRAMSDDEYIQYSRTTPETIDHLEDDSVFVHDKSALGWCRNIKGWINYRHLIENNTSL